MITEDETKTLIILINNINHPNIEKLDYFIENDIFYLIRKYDDDYVIF